MMTIAERVARMKNCSALITGESLGQVASQTMQAIGVTDAVVDLPVFRPLVGMDKEEIIQIARKIDTFDTSILPYEDCCTVFTPKHPKTRPELAKVEAEEAKLDVKALEDEAFLTMKHPHLPAAEIEPRPRYTQRAESQSVSETSCMARTAGHLGKILGMSMLCDRTVRPLRSAGMIEYKRRRAVGEARQVRARRIVRL